MKTGVLLYIDNNLTEKDLTFKDIYLPFELKNRLESIETITEIIFSAPEAYSGNLAEVTTVRRKDADDVSFWRQLFTNSDADNIVKIFCDSPFLDIEIISEMIETHTKYFAEFTYSENLPAGYACEIISKELVNAIPNTGEKTLPLSRVIRSNINQFDVELFYKSPDIRDKRLSFRSGNPREKRILENIYTIAGNAPAYSDIKEIIDRNQDVLYICPSYLEIELSGKCQLDCLFCFRKTLSKEHGEMKIDHFKKILNDMSSIEMPYSICFGGSGEPLLHNNFYEIFDLTRNESLIKNLIIETNGILADDNFKNYIINSKDNRIKIIFNINGMDDETYKSIHKNDYFQTVFKNITSIKNAISNDDSIYIQIMKINETEHFLDKFYDFWEKQKIPIILQKQNTYIGRIEDRRYSDLSPLERTPCWHLQRDCIILNDGKVAHCKQDVNGDFCKGNITTESISQIFDKSKVFFINDYNKNYNTSPDCKSCDEWYTFNL